MAKKRSGGESKAPLIITLILSLLLNLGLGVSVYMYASEEDANLGKYKEEVTKNTSLTGERDKWRHLAWTSLAYMGLLPEGDDFVQLRSERDKYLADAKGQGAEKPLQQFNALEQYAEPKFGWDPVAKKPKKTVEDQLGDWQKAYVLLDQNAKDLAQGKAAAERQVKDLDEQLKEERKTYRNNLAKLGTQVKDDRSADRKTIGDLQGQLTRMNTDHGAALKDKKKETDALVFEIQEKNKEISKLRETLTYRNLELENLKAAASDAPKTLKTDWKVVRVEPLGDNVYVNIGSADRVKQLLTFGVHGVNVDGRVDPKPKGTIEIVEVLEPHLSKARITSTKDNPVNPVMRGDVIYNPTWNPRLKKHVGIVGIIDLDGDNRDDSESFRRTLEKYDVVVDYYLDLENFRDMGPGLSVRTDWLVVGGGVEYKGTGAKGGEYYDQVEAAISKMQAKAKEDGVAVVALRKYLEMIGYPLPPVKTDSVPASIYNPGR